MKMRWVPGELIVRREVLGLQPPDVRGASPVSGVWEALPVFVVEDSPAQLLSYTAPGAEIGFVPGDWPTPDGNHPWFGRQTWQGHGCLMLQEPDDHFAIWHFWGGAERQFLCWYLNIQTAFARTAIGYDTQDLELDIIVFPDGSHEVKDAEVLDDRVAEGRFSNELVDWIREYGAGLTDRLTAAGPWWDQSWANWQPQEQWTHPVLPKGWAS